MVTDQLDGTYDASYSVTRAGRYTLNVASVHQGGLVAEYFENIWLFYAPVVRRVEHVVPPQPQGIHRPLFVCGTGRQRGCC